MASKKRTIGHPKVRNAGAKVRVEEENLAPTAAVPPEQLSRLGTLLPAANAVIQAVEDRMVALQVAATARWTPGQNVHDVDENAPPAFGDDEYADFLDLVEDVSTAAMFQRLAAFFELPETVVNQVLTASLTANISPPNVKTAIGVVSHQRHGQSGQGNQR